MQCASAAAAHGPRQPLHAAAPSCSSARVAAWRPTRARQHSAPLNSRRKPALAPAAVAAGAAAPPPQQRLPASRLKLQNPAKLAGTMQSSIPVLDRGGDVSLERYMHLPPEQYNELDPAMIKALGGASFLLKVPRLSLFGVWVEPEVTVAVRVAQGGDGVVFESGECRLKGSELLSQLGLDRRFVLYFHTMLTWQPGGAAAAAAGAPAAAGGGGAAIHARTDVQVWTEVVGAFQAIPRPALEATGNAVLGAMMQALLPLFLRQLAADYQRWSTDAAYRARRAAPRAAPPPAG